MARQSENLVMGRGELWFAKFATGTFTPAGYRWLGNCPSFKMTRVDTALDHYSSSGGFKLKDDSFNIENSFTGVVQTDDFHVDNLALWAGSDVTQLTQASATASTDTFNSVTPGYAYSLGVTALNPTGVRKVTNVAVKDAVPTTYVENTDYKVDYDNGMVEILSTGSIALGTDLTVTYDVAASTRNLIQPVEGTIEGQLRYIAKNPTPTQRNIFFPRIKIAASGDLTLIQEQNFLTMDLSIETLILNGLPPYFMEDAAA